MIAFSCKLGYISQMQSFDTDEVRALYDQWVKRMGKGSIKRASTAAGVTRQTLSRFRKGEFLGFPHQAALLDLMKADGYALPRSVAREEPAPYFSIPEPNIESVLALKLRAMAEELVCPDFTPAEKAEDFLQFVESLADSLQSHIAAIKKSTDQRN